MSSQPHGDHVNHPKVSLHIYCLTSPNFVGHRASDLVITVNDSIIVEYLVERHMLAYMKENKDFNPYVNATGIYIHCKPFKLRSHAPPPPPFPAPLSNGRRSCIVCRCTFRSIELYRNTCFGLSLKIGVFTMHWLYW